MIKKGMTTSEIRAVIELAVYAAFAAVIEDEEVKLTYDEAKCKNHAVTALTLLAKGIDNRSTPSKTVH